MPRPICPPGGKKQLLHRVTVIENEKNLVRFSVLGPLKQLIQAAGGNSAE